MRTRPFLLSVLLAFSACDKEGDDEAYVAEVCDTERCAEFVLECAAAANPMSDEEGEDLVLQCQHTALVLFCETPCRERPNGDLRCEPPRKQPVAAQTPAQKAEASP